MEWKKRGILCVYSLPRGLDGHFKNECCPRDWRQGFLAIGGKVGEKNKHHRHVPTREEKEIGSGIGLKRTMLEIIAHINNF